MNDILNIILDKGLGIGTFVITAIIAVKQAKQAKIEWRFNSSIKLIETLSAFSDRMERQTEKMEAETKELKIELEKLQQQRAELETNKHPDNRPDNFV